MASYVLVGLLIAAVSAGIALLVIDGKPGGAGGGGVHAHPHDPSELKVNVSGAVSRPGVYAMKEGDRVLDAIAAAGGPRPAPGSPASIWP